jgi:phospholipid/cholesterol/gamma-HCH transport system ATP-binding protein
VVQAEGTSEQLLASDAPFVVQFLHAKPTGPVAFHMKSAPYQEDLRISA